MHIANVVAWPKAITVELSGKTYRDPREAGALLYVRKQCGANPQWLPNIY